MRKNLKLPKLNRNIPNKNAVREGVSRNRRLRRKSILVVTLLTAVLLAGTITFAYFITDSNHKNQTVGLQTGTMSLKFMDNDYGIRAKLHFGETITKKFIIENTGTLEGSLSLSFLNLTSTYLHRSVSYNLSYSDSEDGEYTVLIPETNMPVSDIPITSPISGEISVPAGETYYYNLNVTLNNLEDVEQSRDLDAELNTEFTVDVPSKYIYYRLTIDLNGGSIEGLEKEYLLKNDETLTITNTPTKPGYTFAGWSVQGTASEFVDNTFTMGISDSVLVAEWTPNRYTLTIDTDGGTYPGETTMSVTYQNPIEISEPTKDGYTFAGWEATGGDIENGNFTLTELGNASLKAKWIINNYRYIVYHNKMNTDGATYTLVDADTDEGEAEYNTTITPPVKTYTGFTSPATKSHTIVHETTYPPVLNKIDYDYARNKYNLTIDPNGGTYMGSTSSVVEEMYYDETRKFITSDNALNTLNALGVKSKTGKPTFTTIATTDETANGLYSIEDTYGTSYYYRGAVENNYVKFGDFYWRIIRINGDGSIRMIYDGTSAHSNGEASNDRLTHYNKVWNATINDAKYQGWMFGGANGTASTSKSTAQKNETSSDIKNTVDAWYKTNIIDKGLDMYVGDELFCNDRSTPGKTTTGWSSDTGRGYGTNTTAYGAFSRFINAASGWGAKNTTPKFTCSKNDAFTVKDTTNGNGASTYKVGLITADEVVAAGTNFVLDNDKYYLYKSSDYWYWTMSPRSTVSSKANMFGVFTSGCLANYYANLTEGGGVAPVINIAPEYAIKMIGTGTKENPYTIDTSIGRLEEPSKEGYVFTGWTKTSGTGTLTSSSFTMGEGTTSLQANYKLREYSVTFNANGGSTPLASKKITYTSTYGELPTPTYDGYTFLGWFTEAAGGVEVTSSSTHNIPSNVTLYAHWKAINLMVARSSQYSSEKIWSQKSNITDVVFEDAMNPKENAAYTYDMSVKENGSVMAYLVPNESDSTKYTVYIQSDGKIIANSNFSSFFANLINLISIVGLENVDSSSVTDMSSMFYGCKALTTLNLSNLYTNKVTNMSSMFSDCSNLTTLNVSNFKTSEVTSMKEMFKGCSSLVALDVSSFDTSKVTSMSSIFYKCSSLTALDVNNFNTSNVIDMGYMFQNCSSLTTLDINNFNTNNVISMGYMFCGCSELTTIDVSNFNTSKVTYMSDMFALCRSLTALDVSNFDTSNVTDMSFMFRGCSKLTTLDLNNFDTSKVTSMRWMFIGNNSLTTLNLSNFNTSNVTDMNCIFSGCISLKILDLSNFNTSNVTDMSSMFSNCLGLTILDISNFDTSNVTYMSDMFFTCSKLTTLDLSNFDTSKVTSMSSMLRGCLRLTTLDLSNFDTSKVTNMSHMFYDCSGLTTLDLSNFDTSSVTDMSSMFYDCNGLTTLDVSNFNTSNVTSMGSMFCDCSKLTTTITIRGTKCTSYANMFTDAATSGGKITIKYTEDASSLVDQMVATKSANSNVVKAGSSIPKYTITLNSTDATVDYTEAYDLVQIMLTPTDTNKAITSFKMNGTLIKGNTFKMPSSNVTISDITLIDVTVVESEHNPYPNSLNNQEYLNKTFEGATSLTVTLEYQTEGTSYDYIYLYDKDNTQYGKYGGKTLTTETIEILGDTLRITFRTDSSGNNYYGFKATIIPNY